MSFAYYSRMEELVDDSWAVSVAELGYQANGSLGVWLHECGLFPFWRVHHRDGDSWWAPIAALDVDAWATFTLFVHIRWSEKESDHFETGDEPFPSALGDGPPRRFEAVGEAIDWRHGKQRDLRRQLVDGRGAIVSYRTTLAQHVAPLFPLERLRPFAKSSTHRVVLWCG